jgi:hypothetical protein
MQIHSRRLTVSNFEILSIVASFYTIDCHNSQMLILLIVTAVLIVSLHKYIMSAVTNYDSYGSTTAKQELINFERERLGR